MFYKFLKIIDIKTLAGRGGNSCRIIRKKNNFFYQKINKGGKGGNIYIKIDRSLNEDCLNYYFYYNKFSSENGKNSYNVLENGKNGKNLILRLPCFCKIFNKNKNKFISNYIKNKLILISKGGEGGISKLLSKNNFFYRPACFGEINSLYILNNKKFNISFLGISNSGKSSFLCNFLKNNKISIYNYTTFYDAFFILILNLNKIYILDSPGNIKSILNFNYFNFLNYYYFYNFSIIFFHFLNIFYLFKIKNEFKFLNSDIYSINKKIFYKPRYVIINKIDLFKFFNKYIIFFKFNIFLEWNYYFFFKTVFYNNKNIINFFFNIKKREWRKRETL